MTVFEEGEDENYSKNFNDLNLSSKEINSKVFENCIFKECDFSEVIFNRCQFVECIFIKCNLSVVRIIASKFSDVCFDECKVIGVDWTKALWPDIALCSPLKFYNCIINDSSFFGLSLREIVIQACKAHDVDFRESALSEANFTQTDFSNSLFGKTNLASADFTEACNYQIDVYDNELKNAKFSRYEAIGLLESLGIVLVD
jgi:uncharacterized protein YjbI with pentapeptide repeats